jgi:hypothetical protein
VLAIGSKDRQVQAIPRQDRPELLVLSAATEQWLRQDYATRSHSVAARRDLGELISHGEPEQRTGQDEAADQPALATGEPTDEQAAQAEASETPVSPNGTGVVHLDFSDSGPTVA